MSFKSPKNRFFLVMGVNNKLRLEVIQLYRTLHYLGNEYPNGRVWFHERLKKAFAKNAGETDEQKIRELMDRGNYVVREIEALYKLRKYRAMKSRYYDN